MFSFNEVNYYEHELDLKQVVLLGNLKTLEEAFYICDLSTVARKLQLWKELLPRIQPYYAVKCNNDPLVVETLANLGTGFDCASKREIEMVMKAGATPERIIFAHPCKPLPDLKYAQEHNVLRTTADNEFEIIKLSKHSPKTRVIVRFRSEAKDAVWPLGRKFGCDPKSDATALLLLSRSLNLEVDGSSFHVGCECKEPEAYDRAILKARSIYDFGKLLGYDMSLLDIGGGYPGSNDVQFKEIANVINNAIDEYFMDDPVEIIAEPGRYLVEQAFTLVCKIQAKREVRDAAGKLDTIMYYINDGVYGSFIYVLMEHDPIKVVHFLDNDSDLPKFKSTIWGPTCDSLDKISDNLYLPHLNPGDLIAFPNMGAYTLPLASEFNGIPLPKTLYFQRKSEAIPLHLNHGHKIQHLN
ncbi:ornithine decarboxylase 1-like [Scaptodrosophila lebanonensis]|uniref:ornithine decarboxylase n=1 Tax=Drosophila lebanonensis TaxID=7225 RepID=A0A6J2UFC3_DROLE|nr:ornithine decarboxylase 1-like [Scaptodrosophila lebanonensis]XP_030387161.1 ornithine decarboxylase 1-like [Scaptodrosophila lebanonensis]